jgi:hypothetical protein
MLETKEINSEYGRTCILNGVHYADDNIGYMFSCLTIHLDDESIVHSPSGAFEFTVKVREINTKYVRTYILKGVDEFDNIEYYFHRLTGHINKLKFVENPTSPFEFTVKVWKIGNS